MKTVKNNNDKLLPYFFLLLTMFVGIFFTKNLVFAVQENSDVRENLMMKLEKNESELAKLNELKAQLSQQDSMEALEIEKYNIDFQEEDFLSYFYAYAYEKNTSSRTMIFDAISISEPALNDLGFYESSINLDATFINESALTAFLNFVMSDESEYKFFLGSISYSLENPGSPIKISLPITLYFK